MIPAFVCNRDRLHWPRRLAADLERAGCRVVFVDNASTYPPLLAWYRSCPHEVLRLSENLGQEAPWLSGAVQRDGGDRYIVTDPDLDISAVPDDWLSVLGQGLRFAGIGKVGFSLRTDDIPAANPLRDEIVSWEVAFQRRRIGTLFYWARIDTTLALYDRQRIEIARPRWRDRALRTAAPYAARHLSWYVSPRRVPADERYYLDHSDVVRHSHWSRKLKELMDCDERWSPRGCPST